MAYNAPFDLESLVVNTKAATVYAAHESSLFLGGNLIPFVNVPAGSHTAQVPVLKPSASGTYSDRTTKLTSADHSATNDITATVIADTKVEIPANIYASRTVLRDLGGIDTNEVGRILGNSIQSKFDTDVAAAFAGLTNQQDATNTELTLAEIYKAMGAIRAAGETGPLKIIIAATQYEHLMAAIGAQAFAGGDYQNEAMRTGFVGKIAGADAFVSSYLTATNTGLVNPTAVVFSQDALRIAMFKNVDLEVARRAEAVGFDIVANLHAGVGIVDASRGVFLHLQS
jgi:hypothetical protein